MGHFHADVTRNLTGFMGNYPYFEILEEWSMQWGYEGMIHRPIHWDGPFPLFSCMVDGAKTWSLWPPEFAWHFRGSRKESFECCASLQEELMYDWYDQNYHNHP